MPNLFRFRERQSIGACHLFAYRVPLEKREKELPLKQDLTYAAPLIRRQHELQ